MPQHDMVGMTTAIKGTHDTQSMQTKSFYTRYSATKFNYDSRLSELDHHEHKYGQN